MLISFSVENYLSFKNKVVLDFTAASIKEFQDNVATSLWGGGFNTLKSIGIFGHNSSGKSNLIKALGLMKNFVVNSTQFKEMQVENFKLSSVTESLPSTFEIIFLLNNVRYRYGFSLTSKNIISEWMFVTEKRKEENLFVRALQNFSFDKKFKLLLKGKFELVYEMTRPNTLFLSILAQYNFSSFLNISEWFNNMFFAHDNEHISLVDFTAKLMEVSDFKKLINDVMVKSDLGIDSVDTRIKDVAFKTNYSEAFIATVFGDSSKQYTVKTGHIKYNSEEKAEEKVFFDLLLNESLGTQKFFGILGPILYTIRERGIIFIDEIDARLHSLLLLDIIGLFNSKKTNPFGAQLIFTSHNTNVLRKGLRRDQMILMEKNSQGISSMKSIHAKDPKVRNDATFEKDYLSGKYGAIPELGSQLDLFGSEIK